MSRLRMEWEWVKDYPIFVYMQFIDHNKWDVKVVRGAKGNQHKGNTSPTAPAWFKYESKCNSRRDVCIEACRIAKHKLKG